MAFLVGCFEGSENVLHIHTGLSGLVQGIGKDVKHQFAVGVGVDVTMSLFVEISM